MKLKIEGALILCVVAVLAKTCVEKFTPKVHRTSYNFTSAYQVLLCRFEGLGRETVQAEQPGFVIGGTGTETIYQQTKWRTWLFSIWLSFDIVRFA